MWAVRTNLEKTCPLFVGRRRADGLHHCVIWTDAEPKGVGTNRISRRRSGTERRICQTPARAVSTRRGSIHLIEVMTSHPSEFSGGLRGHCHGTATDASTAPVEAAHKRADSCNAKDTRVSKDISRTKGRFSVPFSSGDHVRQCDLSTAKQNFMLILWKI